MWDDLESCESKGWCRYNFEENGSRGDEGREKIGTVNVVSNICFESVETVSAHDKPDLERGKGFMVAEVRGVY